MRNYRYWLFLVLLMLFSARLSFASNPEEVYRVGAGDVLYISVLGHDDLTTTEVVGPDGMITFPYLDVFKAEGLTLNEIGTQLKKELSPNYIQFPEIIVRLQEPSSQKFYVYGEVRNPGVFRLNKNMTLLKAISMAGGYSAFANKKVVKVLRPNANKPGYENMTVNLEQVINNPAGTQDIFIHNEDIVVVVEK
ncbi:MAG: polysaccharide export protein [Candidatus Omnitrophica bacterium]|nr:polysaccharide export protein [Candidatus Omnitrophota bacterium]